MTSCWALFDASNRLVGQTVRADAGPPGMREIGFARPVRTVRQADLAIERVDPVSGAISEDPAKVEAILIDALKAEAERRKMLLATAGGYKKVEYSEKAAEVNAYDSLSGTIQATFVALSLMPANVRALKFKWAAASAAAFGEPDITKAIERFRAGMMKAANAPAIAAAEERAATAIRAATTAAGKRAAAAAVAWPA